MANSSRARQQFARNKECLCYIYFIQKMKGTSHILSQQFSSMMYFSPTRSSLQYKKTKNTITKDHTEKDLTWSHINQQKLKLSGQKKRQSHQEEHLPSKQEWKKILHENQELKKEVKRLNKMFGSKKSLKGMERLKSEGNDNLEEEVKYLRRIIEKSYISIKEMEKEIVRLNKRLQENDNQCQKLQYKCRLIQIENDTIKNKFNNQVCIHKEEMGICNERIRGLESRIEQLMGMMEQDAHDWRRHKDELSKLKTFYFKRTSS